ncbi:hypothetical protein BTO00_14140 [Vibrio campbellii]|uniref:hypothetical protein n=1 Tax=Vibrio campbellii TaxID=680 RepID=UPI000CF3C09B|nr:hypothetical protein [Vibrio campbellii]PQJ43140.1 hypothetical protein BTO00_14140 [Vibrio campbellii]
MKRHDWALSLLFVVSTVVVFIFEVAAKDAVEWFRGGSELAEILVNLSLSCMAGCVIYYISAFIPAQKELKQKRDEQLKVDEIIASRVRSILDHLSRIYIIAYGNWEKFQDIVIHPLDVQEFEKLTKSISPTEPGIIGRFDVNDEIDERLPMTVEQSISEEINLIKVDCEKLLQLERFLSADLIKCLCELQETAIINNWHILMDSKTMIIAGKAWYSPKGNIANYSSQFKALDVKFREFQKLMLTFEHTTSGGLYSRNLKEALGEQST